jgi:hypothetical protein
MNDNEQQNLCSDTETAILSKQRGMAAVSFQFRKPVLYPTELRALLSLSY